MKHPLKKNEPDASWEEAYAQGHQLNRYPFDIVVSIVMRHFGHIPDKTQIKALDLGCGAGNNSAFLAREGFSVTGIDTSPSAIDYVKNRFEKEGLEGHFHVMNMENLDQLPSGNFDIILDRQTLSTQDYSCLKPMIKKIRRLLKTRGIFISFFHNKSHPGFSECETSGVTEDHQTYYFKQVPSQFFSGSRRITLLDHHSHTDLFSDFKILELYDHKVTPLIDGGTWGIAEYITVMI